MQSLKVAIVQTALHWHDAEHNRDHLGQVLSELDEPADLVVLPEMFTTGFTMEAAACAETMSGPSVAWMRDQARARGAVLCGSVIIEEGGRFYNRLIWMRPDGRYDSYDKRHLFRMAKEDHYFTPGRERLVVELGGWRICPLVCYDLRFPVWSRNRDHYDLLLYVANWPSRRRDAWRTLLRARAMENLSYVVGVNRVGVDGNDIPYSGDSVVLDYIGQPLVEAGDETMTATVSLDRGELEAFRRKFPAHLDADDFDIVLG